MVSLIGFLFFMIIETVSTAYALVCGLLAVTNVVLRATCFGLRRWQAERGTP